MKKRNYAIDVAKIIAMFLVINSHSDVLFPEKIRFLASGGSIGNELFFLISGYLFSQKEDVKKDILSRFCRLYIPTYIMIIIHGMFRIYHIDSIIKFIEVFIWPTHFWFIGAIFIYSIVLYWLIKKGIDHKYNIVLFTCIILVADVLLYIICIRDKNNWIVEDAYFLFIPYRSIYSILSFVFGFYLRRKEVSYNSIRVNPLLLAILSIISFFGFKLCLDKRIIPMSLQIISHPLTVACSVCIFIYIIKSKFIDYICNKNISKLISRLSMLSLGAYLVQFIVIRCISSVNIIFPLNYLASISLIICMAWILTTIDAWFQKNVVRKYLIKSTE